MIYHGIVLSCTFLRRGTERYIFVSDEHGEPLFHPQEWVDTPTRCEELRAHYLDMPAYGGWTVIGTYPVGTVPHDWCMTQ